MGNFNAQFHEPNADLKVEISSAEPSISDTSNVTNCIAGQQLVATYVGNPDGLMWHISGPAMGASAMTFAASALTAPAVNSPNMSFSWMYAGTWAIQVQVGEQYGPVMTFNVKAPGVEEWTATTGTVEVINQNFDGFTQWVAFAGAAPHGWRNGITQNLTIDSNGCSGQVGLVQLVSPLRTQTLPSGQAQQFSLNGQAVLDLSDGQQTPFYQNQTANVGPGGYPSLAANDGPAQSVANQAGPTVNNLTIGGGVGGRGEQFITYLMFRPSTAFGQGLTTYWVPMAYLAWYWSASYVQGGAFNAASSVNPTYYMAPYGPFPIIPPQWYAYYPTWNTNVSTGVFVNAAEK